MPCPAVLTLRSCIEQTIPFLTGKYIEVNGKKLSRLQSGKDGGFNRHDAGLALDIFLFAKKWYKDKTLDWQKERILGHHLVNIFIEMRNQMNWTELIYENIIFKHEPNEISYKRGNYKDNKHFTHIHIDWMDNALKGVIKKPPIPWSNQAKTVDFSATLSTKLSQINDFWEKDYLSALSL